MECGKRQTTTLRRKGQHSGIEASFDARGVSGLRRARVRPRVRYRSNDPFSPTLLFLPDSLGHSESYQKALHRKDLGTVDCTSSSRPRVSEGGCGFWARPSKRLLLSFAHYAWGTNTILKTTLCGLLRCKRIVRVGLEREYIREVANMFRLLHGLGVPLAPLWTFDVRPGAFAVRATPPRTAGVSKLDSCPDCQIEAPLIELGRRLIGLFRGLLSPSHCLSATTLSLFQRCHDSSWRIKADPGARSCRSQALSPFPRRKTGTKTGPMSGRQQQWLG